uniref:Uncharacterized protein n=1 Tax=Wuchereria bancrofti TaxID=6293 RepID=A0A1I8EU49_WUCBA
MQQFVHLVLVLYNAEDELDVLVRASVSIYAAKVVMKRLLEEYRTAEMLRIPVHEIALMVKLIGFLAKVIEPTPIDSVIEAEVLLRARLPIKPVLGKTLILDTACGIGELLATISAASLFATPYIPGDRTTSKLSFQQRSFSGSRFSSYCAYIWCEAYDQDTMAEKDFCERFEFKELNSTVLRIIRYLR